MNFFFLPGWRRPHCSRFCQPTPPNHAPTPTHNSQDGRAHCARCGQHATYSKSRNLVNNKCCAANESQVAFPVPFHFFFASLQKFELWILWDTWIGLFLFKMFQKSPNFLPMKNFFLIWTNYAQWTLLKKLYKKFEYRNAEFYWV